MNDKYWLEFWKKHGRASIKKDEQTQVLRTFNKQPINQEIWIHTLNYLDSQFSLSSSDDVLELCCGNGLFTEHIANRCRSITAVDISADLLDKLKQRNIKNLEILQSDIRKINFEDYSFSHILLYAGIQYLSEAEVAILMGRIFKWVKPGGLMFVGDIPDRARIWSFYNTPEREKLYFDNQISGADMVGTWFDKSWLLKLANSLGFHDARIIEQPSEQINAHYRYDMILQK